MGASRVHLIRHGEVENPTGVVYGRLPGFHLSERGRRQAAAAAAALREMGADVRRVFASPLERARESAAPIAEAYGLDVETDEDFVEATSRLEGKPYDISLQILARPAAWPFLVNPFRPSWGEAYAQVHSRMVRGIRKAADAVDGGDVVIVSHQMPIWVIARRGVGRPLYHDPRRRECAHSSITTFELAGETLTRVAYADPGAAV